MGEWTFTTIYAYSGKSVSCIGEAFYPVQDRQFSYPEVSHVKFMKYLHLELCEINSDSRLVELGGSTASVFPSSLRAAPAYLIVQVDEWCGGKILDTRNVVCAFATQERGQESVRWQYLLPLQHLHDP